MWVIVGIYLLKSSNSIIRNRTFENRCACSSNSSFVHSFIHSLIVVVFEALCVCVCVLLESLCYGLSIENVSCELVCCVMWWHCSKCHNFQVLLLPLMCDFIFCCSILSLSPLSLAFKHRVINIYWNNDSRKHLHRFCHLCVSCRKHYQSNDQIMMLKNTSERFKANPVICRRVFFFPVPLALSRFSCCFCSRSGALTRSRLSFKSVNVKWFYFIEQLT